MPFIDVIRSEVTLAVGTQTIPCNFPLQDVTGYLTGLALTAVYKFLSYDIIGSTSTPASLHT